MPSKSAWAWLRDAGAPTPTLQPSDLGACDRRTTLLDSSISPLPLHEPASPVSPFKQVMLESAMFIGLGLVAVWAHVRFPRLRPSSLLRAILHVAISFGAFTALPVGLGYLLPLAPSPTQARYVALALLIPTLTWLLLTWVWLLARVLQDLGSGTPRGGHPASSES